MKPIGGLASHAVQSPQQLTASSNGSTEAVRAAAPQAKLLLGCYRIGDANDPEVYVAAVTVVLAQYPLDVQKRVVNPRTGLPSKLKWLPTIPEIHAACQEIDGLNRRIREYDERSQKQVDARHEPQATETLDEMWEDMRRRGWQPTARQAGSAIETVESVKKKFGLTDEQWNALPDLPERSKDWERNRIDRDH